MHKLSNHLYHIQCFFNPSKTSLIEGIRGAHREYIHVNEHYINYGGLFEDEEERKGIILFIHSESSEEALKFIQNDPYYELYDNVKICKFELKIPKVL